MKSESEVGDERRLFNERESVSIQQSVSLVVVPVLSPLSCRPPMALFAAELEAPGVRCWSGVGWRAATSASTTARANAPVSSRSCTPPSQRQKGRVGEVGDIAACLLPCKCAVESKETVGQAVTERIDSSCGQGKRTDRAQAPVLAPEPAAPAATDSKKEKWSLSVRRCDGVKKQHGPILSDLDRMM